MRSPKLVWFHLTKSLAAEWARYGNRVSSISQGIMRTVQYGEIIGAPYGVLKQAKFNGEAGKPEGLAGAVILLYGRIGGKYITGGGYCCR